MANLVLYRKYRPKTFAEVIGQPHVVRTLMNALERDLVSHAYLFAGPRGCGKTTVARILAKAVNCEKRRKSEPCNECAACLEINSGRAMDIIEIDAASNRGIDEVRDLREGVRFVPSRLKSKVFIVDEAHQLTKEAANAILKLLEEPPEHAMFILATTEAHKMIPTIISRCQRFDFRRIAAADLVERLDKIAEYEGKDINKSVLALIALQAQGSVRDGESILGQVITFSLAMGKKSVEAEDVRDLLGLVEMQAISRLMGMVFEKTPSEAVAFLNEILERGRDSQELAKSIVHYLRNGVLLKINPEFHDPIIIGLGPEEIKILEARVSKISEPELHRIVKLFIDAENKTRYSSIPQLPLEMAIVEATIENK